ncbi:hypothetical protein [Ferrimonas sp. SCSIO 43195]|uniref:helix-turn-helix transcriptional regulator n=1 Tax=Ferrimonas sp. SCSIO 43195 TaxID=2822844 RepID=UPI002076090F|nr:hypothetical protein [Ferrimonas sp. SCSIO 43195]USD36328.1 hypothetical protein J8Z22_15035 [Ferrimonas sp. SCSIO 43195]
MSGGELGVSELIRQRLTKLCREVGAADMAYCIDVRCHSDFFASQSKLHRRWQQRKQVFFSSVNLSQCFDSWRSNCLASDRNFNRSHHHSVYDWHYSPESPDSARAINIIHNHGYSRVSSFSVPCPFSGRYVARFVIIDDPICRDRDNPLLFSALEHFHIQSVLDFGESINPLLDLHLVSPMAQQVLKLFSLGCSRLEVSEGCNITERGVDYHVDALKRLFGAANMPELMYQACTQRLI